MITEFEAKRSLGEFDEDVVVLKLFCDLRTPAFASKNNADFLGFVESASFAIVTGPDFVPRAGISKKMSVAAIRMRASMDAIFAKGCFLSVDSGFKRTPKIM